MSGVHTINWTEEDDDGNEVGHRLPAKYEVCDRCCGEGSHVHPAIDGNGITASEWAEWDDEEKQDYLAGNYDVPCEKCGGQRVLLVPDLDLLEKQDPELFKIYQEYVEAEAQSRREEAYVQRMGF